MEYSVVSLLGRINILLSSQSIFFTIFFCSYLKTSALASITWTRFIFPPEEALMLMDIMNAQRLFLYRERTAMISSTRHGWKLLSLIQHIREHVNWIKLTNELNSKFFAAQNFKVKFGKDIKIAFLSVYPILKMLSNWQNQSICWCQSELEPSARKCVWWKYLLLNIFPKQSTSVVS